MKLTGHKSAEVHRGYTHLELETLKAAMAKLPSLTAKNRAKEMESRNQKSQSGDASLESSVDHSKPS